MLQIYNTFNICKVVQSATTLFS